MKKMHQLLLVALLVPVIISDAIYTPGEDVTKPPKHRENLQWPSNHANYVPSSVKPPVRNDAGYRDIALVHTSRGTRQADNALCPENATGQFTYLPDCRKFINCWKGRGFIQACAPGTLFNPRSLECDFPAKVKCLPYNEESGALTEEVLEPEEKAGEEPDYVGGGMIDVRMGRDYNPSPISSSSVVHRTSSVSKRLPSSSSGNPYHLYPPLDKDLSPSNPQPSRHHPTPTLYPNLAINHSPPYPFYQPPTSEQKQPLPPLNQVSHPSKNPSFQSKTPSDPHYPKSQSTESPPRQAGYPSAGTNHSPSPWLQPPPTSNYPTRQPHSLSPAGVAHHPNGSLIMPPGSYPLQGPGRFPPRQHHSLNLTVIDQNPTGTLNPPPGSYPGSGNPSQYPGSYPQSTVNQAQNPGRFPQQSGTYPHYPGSQQQYSGTYPQYPSYPGYQQQYPVSYPQPSSNQRQSPGYQQPHPGSYPHYPGNQQQYPGSYPQSSGNQRQSPGNQQPHPGSYPHYPGNQQQYPGSYPQASSNQGRSPGNQQPYPGSYPQSSGSQSNPGYYTESSRNVLTTTERHSYYPINTPTTTPRGKDLVAKHKSDCSMPGGTGVAPHPSDCGKYLDCWKGSAHTQSCAPGTLFNPALLQCDHPYNVDCKRNTDARDPGPGKKWTPLPDLRQSTSPAHVPLTTPKYPTQKTDLSHESNPPIYNLYPSNPLGSTPNPSGYGSNPPGSNPNPSGYGSNPPGSNHNPSGYGSQSHSSGSNSYPSVYRPYFSSSTPNPSGYGSNPQGSNPNPSGYGSNPSGSDLYPSGSNPRGLNTNPSGYGSNPSSSTPYPSGYGSISSGSNPNPSGYGSNPSGSNPNPSGYGSNPPGSNPTLYPNPYGSISSGSNSNPAIYGSNPLSPTKDGLNHPTSKPLIHNSNTPSSSVYGVKPSDIPSHGFYPPSSSSQTTRYPVNSTPKPLATTPRHKILQVEQLPLVPAATDTQKYYAVVQGEAPKQPTTPKPQTRISTTKMPTYIMSIPGPGSSQSKPSSKQPVNTTRPNVGYSPTMMTSGQTVRLRGGPGPFEGYVEVQSSSPGWGLVCDDTNGWDIDEATVVCKQLGYVRGAELSWQGRPVRPTDDTIRVSVSEVKCSGSEDSLSSCRVTRGAGQCVIQRDAVGVRCYRNHASVCQPDEVNHGGKCYSVIVPKEVTALEAFSHGEALADCQKRKGKLLDITSQSESDFISELLLQSYPHINSIITSGVGVKVMGHPLWIWEGSGESFKFQKWWPGWTGNDTLPTASAVGDRMQCVVAKRVFPCQAPYLPDVAGLANLCEANYFYWATEDCSVTHDHPYVCERPNDDVGCVTDAGQEYMGVANVSTSGATCIPWDSPITPASLKYRMAYKVRQTTMAGHNHCRNIGGGETHPWCYVGPQAQFQYCDIPECCSLAGQQTTNVPPSGITDCGLNEYECQPGECILASLVCNKMEDCSNGKDENDCPDIAVCNSSNEFECHPREVVIGSLVCDGKADCSNGRDELNCTGVKKPRRHGSHMEKFECLPKECVLASRVCDGTQDCSNGKDEAECRVGENVIDDNRNCSMKEFECQPGHCIPSLWACDGVRDCPNGIDEDNCPGVEKAIAGGLKCGSNEFECRPGECVLATWVCDGAKDCSNGRDEKDCTGP